jgi:hypothetical protein
LRSASIAFLAALLLGGCAARRTLAVTSEPPGAEVRLDDELLGVTPLAAPISYYGVRHIVVYKQGYQTQSELIELDPPLYARFPLDFFTEVLFPFGWKDRRELHVVLVPGEEILSRPGLGTVFERAQALRQAGPEGPRELPRPRLRELPQQPEPAPPRPESAPEPDAP